MTRVKPNRYRLRRRVIFSTIALAIVSVCGYWWLTVPYRPWHPRPGEGRKALRGFHAAAPLISSLQKFHADHARYPKELGELTPEYIGQIPPMENGGFVYERDGGVYRLQFRYVGPGINTCVYSPNSGWICGGYY